MTSINDIVKELYDIYHKIDNIYHSEITNIEKWKNIAIIINDNNEKFFGIYQIIKKEPLRKEINLNYHTELPQLNQQIDTENLDIMKASLIITALHHIVYDLMSREDNYYFSLDGEKEMYSLKKKITYYINLSVKKEQNIFFFAFFIVFSLESTFNKHFYLGMDFEGTTKKIQLAQLCFEHNVSLKSFIMIISPDDLDAYMILNFINLILCNKSIRKILHGSDSLDVPYIYEQLLNNDKNKIIKFTKGLIDTRFLCEYYKINIIGKSDNKCTIYDEDQNKSSIYFFGLISLGEQENLAKILESIGPDHVWNIHRMPRNQVLYAQYDVIFLKYFYYRIIHVATENITSEIDKKAVIELYKYVLYELTQFVYLEKKKVTFISLRCKEEADPMNNYMIHKGSETVRLNDYFNLLGVNIITFNPKVELDKILKVSYYKITVEILMKKLFYTAISKKYRIFKNKSNLWLDKIDNNYVFEFFHNIKFYYLGHVFQDIYKIFTSLI